MVLDVFFSVLPVILERKMRHPTAAENSCSRAEHSCHNISTYLMGFSKTTVVWPLPLIHAENKSLTRSSPKGLEVLLLSDSEWKETSRPAMSKVFLRIIRSFFVVSILSQYEEIWRLIVSGAFCQYVVKNCSRFIGFIIHESNNSALSLLVISWTSFKLSTSRKSPFPLHSRKT